MGINNLFQHLKKKHPKLTHKKYLTNICYGKKILVDISSYIYKYKAIYNDYWLKMFINFILFFKKSNLHITFIFDGKAPILKEEEQKRRFIEKEKLQDKAANLYIDLENYKNTGEKTDFLIDIMTKIIKNREKKGKVDQKVKKLLHSSDKKEEQEILLDVDLLEGRLKTIEGQLFSITDEDIWNLKTILNYLGICYIQANTEAETLACYLCNQGKASIVISEDSDTLAYLNENGIAISKFKPETGMCDVIYKKEVLKEFEMTNEQFLDFCILSGNDYNENIKLIGPVKAETHIKKYGSIEKFIKKANNEAKKKINFDNIKKYKEVRAIFNCEEIPMGRLFDKDQKEDKFENNKLGEFEIIEKIPTWETVDDFSKIFTFLKKLNIKMEKEITDAWTDETEIEIEFIE